MDSWPSNAVERLTKNGINCRADWIQQLHGVRSDEELYSRFCQSDLQESSCGSLPGDFLSLQDAHLSGCHILQVEAAVDISRPVLHQRAGAVRNNGPREKRMLKMLLTDGVIGVIALEHRSISMLNEIESNGRTKILVCGSPKILKGVLLLEEKHVRLLYEPKQKQQDTNPDAAFAAPIPISNDFDRTVDRGIKIEDRKNFSTAAMQTGRDHHMWNSSTQHSYRQEIRFNKNEKSNLPFGHVNMMRYETVDYENNKWLNGSANGLSPDPVANKVKCEINKVGSNQFSGTVGLTGDPHDRFDISESCAESVGSLNKTFSEASLLMDRREFNTSDKADSDAIASAFLGNLSLHTTANHGFQEAKSPAAIVPTNDQRQAVHERNTSGVNASPISAIEATTISGSLNSSRSLVKFSDKVDSLNSRYTATSPTMIATTNRLKNYSPNLEKTNTQTAHDPASVTRNEFQPGPTGWTLGSTQDSFGVFGTIWSCVPLDSNNPNVSENSIAQRTASNMLNISDMGAPGSLSVALCGWEEEAFSRFDLWYVCIATGHSSFWGVATSQFLSDCYPNCHESWKCRNWLPYLAALIGYFWVERRIVNNHGHLMMRKINENSDTAFYIRAYSKNMPPHQLRANTEWLTKQLESNNSGNRLPI